MTSSVTEPRRGSKALPKANLYQKRSRSLFADLLPVWSSTAFWIPEKPLHLRSMLSTSMRCTKTATPAAGIAQQTGPNSSSWQHSTTHCTTNASKAERIGFIRFEPIRFASSVIFTWPLANQLPCLQASQQLSAGNNTSTTSRRQKMLSKSSLNPEAWICMLQE